MGLDDIPDALNFPIFYIDNVPFIPINKVKYLCLGILCKLI